ncbi:hypothetical protein RT939_001314 [Staphylococcus pseudintermedius]|nr:hypothetical protein [Staphylococcus pseudintermedius]
MIISIILLVFVALTYFVQVYTAYLTFNLKNIKFGKSLIYFILPFFSVVVHILISYRAFKRKKFKKAFKALGYSFSKYNIFLNILSGVILEEILIFETYGHSKLISKKEEVNLNTSKKEMTILQKVLKKPLNTAKQVAPIYN